MGLAIAACGGAHSPTEPSAWVLPFPLDSDNGCQVVATPYSVANPWDWAHDGLDFACVAGTPVLSVADGNVVSVESADVNGGPRSRIVVELRGSALRVEYINLSQASVVAGDEVSQGSEIGTTATGLHLSVWDREAERYVDPGVYLVLPESGR
jgi:murein DD-endopeptidase MepM/ murein hydrolase activator NlpD